MIIARHLKRVALALPILGTFGLMQSALATGTDAGTPISNLATVSYSVGSVAQTPIQSSPTGNTTATGSATTFVVDNQILHVVSEFGTAVNATSPGANNVVATFRVTNQGNTAQGYLLTAINEATASAAPSFGTTADNTDVTNLRVRVEAGAVPGGNASAYDLTDTAFNISSLAEDAFVQVYVLADVPLTATNNQFANVRLAAQATTNGTTTVVTQTATADNPAVVDVVFADAGATARDGFHEAIDQYAVSSATLSVAKTVAVISDPFGTSSPKAIPLAVVEYSIVVTNTGGSDAIDVVITDPIPGETTFLEDVYSSNTRDVSIQVGSDDPTFCIAEDALTDTNGDGCYRTGSSLFVTAPGDMVATGPTNAVTVRFRARIN
jgi:uncharacterized repeat protein (TIGR01451 family)